MDGEVDGGEGQSLGGVSGCRLDIALCETCAEFRKVRNA